MSAKLNWFQKIAASTNKIHQEDFLRVAVLNRSLKGAMDRLFSQRILSVAFHQQKVSKTEMLKQIGVTTNEIFSKAYWKYLFETTLRKEQ